MYLCICVYLCVFMYIMLNMWKKLKPVFSVIYFTSKLKMNQTTDHSETTSTDSTMDLQNFVNQPIEKPKYQYRALNRNEILEIFPGLAALMQPAPAAAAAPADPSVQVEDNSATK